ncbi:prepilin-type N-terminal cleavage/methylation domain-containing protein [Bdellovibrio sp. HCB185ZH]|uniref:type IV pilus modification PilV family protein n=1 Tax=Bdellovibrio sp. HCB185ZH TaxID=3394235 RepID=UPI0039A6D6FE
MFKNQKGLTLVEVMIGIGLFAIVISIVVAVQVKMSQQHFEMIRKLDDSVDQNLAERILFKDLSGIDISYNNLVVKDDRGNNFYDFYPDITENILKVRADRELNLKLDGKNTFYVFSQNAAAGALLTYDPMWAYDVGPEPADPNVPATLTFNGEKNRKWISNEKNGGRPGFWKEGHLLFYDTPSRIRPSVGDVIDKTIPPRSSFYVGSVNATTNILQNMSGDAAGLFNMTEPDSGETINSLDEFLRKVPAVGGGQTIVRVRAARLVKYYIEPDTKKNAELYDLAPANFYMAEYRDGQFEKPTLLADGVGRVLFRRDSVIKKMIYFKIQKAQLK